MRVHISSVMYSGIFSSVGRMNIDLYIFSNNDVPGALAFALLWLEVMSGTQAVSW